jgi:hypothetical protein
MVKNPTDGFTINMRRLRCGQMGDSLDGDSKGCIDLMALAVR